MNNYKCPFKSAFLIVSADCVPEAKEVLRCRECPSIIVCNGPIKIEEVEE